MHKLIAHHVIQRATRQILSHHINQVIRLIQSIKFHQIGMVDLSQCIDLILQRLLALELDLLTLEGEDFGCSSNFGKFVLNEVDSGEGATTETL